MKQLIVLNTLLLLATNILVAQNVGIGTTTPTAKLEVVHKSGTGLQLGSTVGSSTVDIDAFDGAAGLRLKHKGQPRWGLVNNPLTGDFEVNQLVDGTNYLTLDRYSGYMGLGTNVPTAQLEIVNNGGVGMILRSKTGYSTLDIFGVANDAALRLGRDGILHWNVRNDGATDNFSIFEMGAIERLTIQNNTGYVGIGTTAPAAKLDVNGRTNTNQLQVGEGTVISNMQSGSFAAGPSDNAFLTATLTFPTAFGAAPRVTATARNASNFSNVNDTYAVTIRSVSATAVTFNIRRVDVSAAWSQNLLIDWIAIQ